MHHSVVSYAKTAERIEMQFELWTLVAPLKHLLDGGPKLPCEGAIISERTYLSMPNDTLPCAVLNWLNRSICHFGCGLRWAEGITNSVVFIRWRQCALPHWCQPAITIEPSVCSGDVAFYQLVRTKKLLECGPMPNVMAALPNIGGALCSTLQSLAAAQY